MSLGAPSRKRPSTPLRSRAAAFDFLRVAMESAGTLIVFIATRPAPCIVARISRRLADTWMIGIAFVCYQARTLGGTEW